MKSRLFLCHAKPCPVAHFDSQAPSPAPGRPGSSLPLSVPNPCLPGCPHTPLSLATPTPGGIRDSSLLVLSWNWLYHSSLGFSMYSLGVGAEGFFFFFFKVLFYEVLFSMTSHQDTKFQILCCAFRFCLLDWKIPKVGN